MYGTRITFTNILRALEKGFSERTLVPKRPNQNARTVFVPLDKRNVPIVNSLFEKYVFGVFRPRLLFVAAVSCACAVHFEIGFIHHVDPNRVAKLVKFRHIRVMGRSDGVHV